MRGMEIAEMLNDPAVSKIMILQPDSREDKSWWAGPNLARREGVNEVDGHCRPCRANI